MEVWLPIPSLPGYLASSEGRLMIEPHKKPMPYGGFRTYGGKAVIGQWQKKEKRFIYGITLNGKCKTYRVARLICEAFNGPPPQDKQVCMHLDENSRNNKPENLAWGTQKDNLNALGFIKYCKSRTGVNNPFIKGRKT